MGALGEASQFLSHSKDERTFFLLLLQHNRAGSLALEKYFAEQIKNFLQQRLDFKNRIKVQSELRSNDQTEYYSEWYYAAIHLLTDIFEFQSRDAIVERLQISPQIVNEVLEFLTSVGLVKKQGSLYVMAKSHVHLDSDSPLISQHHRNWRLQALNSISKRNPDTLHYSSVVTCSQDDAIKVRALMVESVEKIRKIIKASKGESLFCYSMDLFEV